MQKVVTSCPVLLLALLNQKTSPRTYKTSSRPDRTEVATTFERPAEAQGGRANKHHNAGCTDRNQALQLHRLRDVLRRFIRRAGRRLSCREGYRIHRLLGELSPTILLPVNLWQGLLHSAEQLV